MIENFDMVENLKIVETKELRKGQSWVKNVSGAWVETIEQITFWDRDV